MAMQLSTFRQFHAVPTFYRLHIMLVEKPSSFYNELEDVTYHATRGELVLKGTMDEPWIIPSKKLQKYELLDGTPLTPELLEGMEHDTWIEIQTRKVDESTVTPTVCARVPVGVVGEVITERGDVLQVNRPGVPHGEGDVLCGVDTPWPWVVNGEVFARTYRII